MTLPGSKKNAVCSTCTLKLVALAYRRAPLFRLIREPLKLGMRLLARAYRINPAVYEVRTPACYGCMRFYKVALKERSALFRWLNNLVNPIFDTLLARIVTQEEIEQAQIYAQAATVGRVSPEQAPSLASAAED